MLLRGDIDMMVSGQKNSLTHMAWQREDEDRQVVHYLQLDPLAKPLVDRHLELPGDQMRHPKILILIFQATMAVPAVIGSPNVCFT